MNRLTLRRVSRQLRQNGQRGFTLIELLVVVSILGILAAVVTMSLVGITRMAQDRAAKTELQTVQTAYDTMLADQQVPVDKECDGAPTKAADATNHMDHFPDMAPASHTDPAQDTVPLSPTYLRTPVTHGTYFCVPGEHGKIQQAVYNQNGY